jgi:hypothetical protein
MSEQVSKTVIPLKEILTPSGVFNEKPDFEKVTNKAEDLAMEMERYRAGIEMGEEDLQLKHNLLMEASIVLVALDDEVMPENRVEEVGEAAADLVINFFKLYRQPEKERAEIRQQVIKTVHSSKDNTKESIVNSLFLALNVAG